MNESLKIKIELSDAEEATDSLNRLADAAKRAEVALLSLANLQHGGIEVRICGELSAVTIIPPEEK